jgi:multisubunit Na+/H+ antiporter MnhF subunit
MFAFENLIAGMMILLVVSLGVAMARLLLGSNIIDRVLALDVMLVHGVGLAVLYVLLTGQYQVLDSLLAVAVAGFLGTVALARYIEQGGR